MQEKEVLSFHPSKLHLANTMFTACKCRVYALQTLCLQRANAVFMPYKHYVCSVQMPCFAASGVWRGGAGWRDGRIIYNN